MNNRALPISQVKKRPVALQHPRIISFPTVGLSASGRNVYKMQERAATHDEIMQRFQLRKVPSDKSFANKFGHGKHVIIDKATGGRRKKNQRFSLRRFLRLLIGRKARKHFFRTLMSPITPKSWTSTAHGILMLVIYHVQLIYLPFSPSYFPHGSLYSSITTIMMESVFFLDLLLNLNTAYVEQGILVTSRSKIALNYFRKWFAFDLLSAVPIQTIFCIATSTIDRTHPTVRGVQLTLVVLRLLRVTFLEKGVLMNRVMRVGKHVAEWVRYSRYSHLLGIAQLMWIVLLFAHYMACFWHVVSGRSNSEDNISVGEKYVADYYYAVSLIQGQGNSVGTWDENLYSSVAIIVGSVILAIVFGNVAMLVSNFNANTTNYHRKMEAVYATMDKMDLPLKLRERVNEYYTHVWHEYEALDGNINKFQQELTYTLRIEIGLYKYMNLVVKIPFWADCTPDFLTQIVLNLGVRVYMPDDYVVRRREVGSEMMMINLGYCKMSTPLRLLLPAKVVGTVVPDPDVYVVKAEEVAQTLALGNGFDGHESSSDENDEMSSEDDSDDDIGNPMQVKDRRFSGSVFELQGSEVTNMTAESSPENALPRRHSNPSSIQPELPKKYCVYLNPGQAFGEMSLLMNYKRQASVRAVTFVEMCVLDRKTFQNIISRYPEDRRKVLTKMLESCIKKNEIPFPWENIIEAVTVMRRNSGYKDLSRASVIATMTAAEVARILVEAIDVNIPDESIKYGFQNFEQEFVDEQHLRRANSVGAKIRDTLQRTNSGIRDSSKQTHSGPQRMNIGSRNTLQKTNSGTPLSSRRNSRAESVRTTDLTESDSEMSVTHMTSNGGEHVEKTLESMMQLMHTMVEKIGHLQQDVNDLKTQGCCCKRRGEEEESSRESNHRSSASRSYLPSSPVSAPADLGCASARTDSLVSLKRKPAAETSRKSSLLAALPSIKRQNSGNSAVDRSSGLMNNARGLVNSGRGLLSIRRGNQSSLRRRNTGMKNSPQSIVSTLARTGSTSFQLDSSGPRRSKTGRNPTLADLLWKRSSTSIDLLKDSQPDMRRQQFKTRHSLPAGGASVASVTCGTNEMLRIQDDHEHIDSNREIPAQPNPRSREPSYLEYDQASTRDASGQSNSDLRCCKIDE